MSTFTATVAAMYWSRVTALFGPDSFDDSGTFPLWNDEVKYTISDTLLSNRPTMYPSWALYVVLGVQPVLISVIFIASFVLGYFSAVDGNIRHHRHPCRRSDGDVEAFRGSVVFGDA